MKTFINILTICLIILNSNKILASSDNQSELHCWFFNWFCNANTNANANENKTEEQTETVTSFERDKPLYQAMSLEEIALILEQTEAIDKALSQAEQLDNNMHRVQTANIVHYSLAYLAYYLYHLQQSNNILDTQIVHRGRLRRLGEIPAVINQPHIIKPFEELKEALAGTEITITKNNKRPHWRNIEDIGLPTHHSTIIYYPKDDRFTVQMQDQTFNVSHVKSIKVSKSREFLEFPGLYDHSDNVVKELGEVQITYNRSHSGREPHTYQSDLEISYKRGILRGDTLRNVYLQGTLDSSHTHPPFNTRLTQVLKKTLPLMVAIGIGAYFFSDFDSDHFDSNGNSSILLSTEQLEQLKIQNELHRRMLLDLI